VCLGEKARKLDPASKKGDMNQMDPNGIIWAVWAACAQCTPKSRSWQGRFARKFAVNYW
jgi:hypothetical protein